MAFRHVGFLVIGFTGTAAGMTQAQLASAEDVYVALNGNVLHHGLCIGSDEQMHHIAARHAAAIIGHPPVNEYKLARCECREYRQKKPYLVRNQDIVDESDVLLATPKGNEEELRSGTWSTVRYARKQHKLIFIIWPNGVVTFEAPPVYR